MGDNEFEDLAGEDLDPKDGAGDSAPVVFEKDELVSYGTVPEGNPDAGKPERAVIRLAHEDGTYDVELLDRRAADEQPLWFPNVAAESIQKR